MRAQLGVQGDSQTEELRERIWWLVRLRWAAAAGVTVVVWSVPRLVGVPLAERPLYLITAGLAGYNLVLWVASYRLPFAARPFLLKAIANLQIGVDLLFLTALLHFAGGIENPLVCYYVFHIVIASILLSRRATYAHTVLALGLVSLMAGLEATGRIAHYHLAGFTGSEHYRSPTYVFAILLVVGSMLTFTAFMATSITAQLRRREGEVVRLSQSLQEHTADLERAYEELSRLERGKSEYLHRVAHHLRSPLAALERMLAVVSEGRTGPLNEKSHEMIVRAGERVRNMLDLARDLLALSRAQETSPLAHRQPMDLAEILASVENDFRPQAASNSVSLESKVGAQVSPIVGDPESISDLLENLISNAVKYTPAGGKVRVVIDRKGDRVEISVSDTGIGIPAAEKERIFEEFYRASNARESGKEGTGLGLSIVQAIASAQGGEVAMESEVGAGTTFRVLLPAAPPDIAADLEAARRGAQK